MYVPPSPHRCCLIATLIGCLLITTTSHAQTETPYYFLKDTDVGSEANFSPFTVLLNTGFDILRSGSYQKRLTKIDYRTGAINISKNVWSMNHNIQQGEGWPSFISHEIFPYLEFNLAHGHFVPNYFLHAIGEGMLFRKLEEWYRANDVEWSGLSALGTIFFAQFLNEAVENGPHVGPNADPIADLVFFNPLGWFLFSLDSVAQFFSETISMGFWPGQPSLDLTTMSLYNTGESYFFRSTFDFMEPLSLFGYIGSEGVGGLSWKFNTTDSVTLAAGYRVVWLEATGLPEYRQLVAVEPGNWLGGFFWDRNDSLLLSVLYGEGADPTLRVNIFPGVLNTGPVQLGAFLWTSTREGVIAGVNLSIFPLGIAVQAGGDPSRKVF